MAGPAVPDRPGGPGRVQESARAVRVQAGQSGEKSPLTDRLSVTVYSDTCVLVSEYTVTVGKREKILAPARQSIAHPRVTYRPRRRDDSGSGSLAAFSRRRPTAVSVGIDGAILGRARSHFRTREGRRRERSADTDPSLVTGAPSGVEQPGCASLGPEQWERSAGGGANAADLRPRRAQCLSFPGCRAVASARDQSLSGAPQSPNVSASGGAFQTAQRTRAAIDFHPGKHVPAHLTRTS